MFTEPTTMKPTTMTHDDEKVRKLEKRVSKLESEVTVLETAMADLAKRLLVVEQKSGLKNQIKSQKLF